MAFHEDGDRFAATFLQDEVYMTSYTWRLETLENQTFELDTDILWSPNFNYGISYLQAGKSYVELYVNTGE